MINRENSKEFVTSYTYRFDDNSQIPVDCSRTLDSNIDNVILKYILQSISFVRELP
jgi:hypothetical protein